MSHEIISDQWVECMKVLPPEGQVVMTKIHDANGCRNEQELKRKGPLWLLPDGDALEDQVRITTKFTGLRQSTSPQPTRGDRNSRAIFCYLRSVFEAWVPQGC